MQEHYGTPLAPLTTLRLGGPARRLVVADTDDLVVEETRRADEEGTPLLVVGGGSNLVVGDKGFDGTALRIATRGVRQEGTVLDAAAGEVWADLVARSVDAGLAGIECLAGIPGSVGATPIQNVGAYGQAVADSIVSVRVYDRVAGEVRELSHAECEFGYRTSRFRHGARYVVLEVTFALERSPLARPIRYPELARVLGVPLDARPPLPAVREAVLAMRRRKGMVIDPGDPDSRSAGSFFLNPVLSATEFAALEQRVGERPGPPAALPAWPDGDGRVKTSAAWLIEHAGFGRGYGDGRVGISGKHTLALVNRGGATTGELLALAQTVRRGVADAFGITLNPEPTLVGVAL